jgi:hypothetical protein
MSSALRPAAIFAAILALTALAMPGCSQQGEGERCVSAENGDGDCNSGLTCVASGKLLDKSTDRCCPAEGTQSDSRCTRDVPGADTNGGAGSEDDTGDSAGTGGTEASGGAPMNSTGGVGGSTAPVGGSTSDSGGMSTDESPGGAPSAAGAGAGAVAGAAGEPAVAGSGGAG